MLEKDFEDGWYEITDEDDLYLIKVVVENGSPAAKFIIMLESHKEASLPAGTHRAIDHVLSDNFYTDEDVKYLPQAEFPEYYL